MENADFIPREFNLENNGEITPPKPPIQVEALLPKLNENKEIEDLLDWVLDALPNRSLEECFTVIFKIFDDVSKNGTGTIRLVSQSSQSYSRGSKNLEFSKIKWSG